MNRNLHPETDEVEFEVEHGWLAYTAPLQIIAECGES